MTGCTLKNQSPVTTVIFMAAILDTMAFKFGFYFKSEIPAVRFRGFIGTQTPVLVADPHECLRLSRLIWA